MGDTEAALSASGGKKTVQVDLASHSSGGKIVGKRVRPRSDSAASKNDITEKSAELQAAVEQALAAAGRPGRPDAPPPVLASANSSSTKRVSSDLLGQPVSASHPRSTNSVATAVQELNQLMQQRLQARMRKTMRAGARRGQQHEQQLAEEPSMTQARPGTPLVSNSTAARVPNDPPWGCLKGGDKQTWREYKHHTTMRASRNSTPLTASVVTPAPTGQISTATHAPAQLPTTTHTPPSPLASIDSSKGNTETVTVGRQKDGRVAFVVGNREYRTRRHQAKPIHQSVTNRAKLRKARLTKGGSQTPQRLIDAIADSVDAIGSVVNVHSSSNIS